MTERPLARLSAQSGPSRPPAGDSAGAARRFIPVRCTGTRPHREGGQAIGQRHCNQTLLEVPVTWLVAVTVLQRREDANGRDPVKKCERCGSHVELRGWPGAAA